jgi:hypothetical protein
VLDLAPDFFAFTQALQEHLAYTNSEADTRSNLIDPVLQILGYRPAIFDARSRFRLRRSSLTMSFESTAARRPWFKPRPLDIR